MSRSLPDKNDDKVFNRLSGKRDVVQIGHLVCSAKGRDKGRFYLVVGCDDPARICLADGERRKVENPKYKNIKHLDIREAIAGEIKIKAANGRRINNADIRKELKSFVKELD